MRTTIIGLLLAGCSSPVPAGPRPSTVAAIPEAAVARPQLPAPPAPRGIGAWSHQQVMRGSPHGLTFIDDDVLIYGQDLWDIKPMLARRAIDDADAGWAIEAIAPSGAVSIASRKHDDRVGFFFHGSRDYTTLETNVRFRELGGDAEPIVDRCKLTGSLATTDGDDVLVHSCAHRPVLMRRGASGWRSIVEIPVKDARPSMIGIDATGAVHVASRKAYRDLDGYWIVEGTAVRTVSPPPPVTALRGCNGALYALLDRHDADGLDHRRDLGRWNGSSWEREVLADEIDPSVLGFDEECRVYLGGDGAVWSHDGERWVSASLAFRHGHGIQLDQLGGAGGMLFATYETTDGGGAIVNVAWAPLVAP